MTRDQAISTIEDSYSPDSTFITVAAIGCELLHQARRDCDDWRNEPDAVLFRLAKLCEQRVRDDERTAERYRHYGL